MNFRSLAARTTGISFLSFLLAAGLMAQGVTTAQMRGTVTDQSGSTLPGASVVVTHMPSGSAYGTATNSDGQFQIVNMRVGGPYTVEVSFVGFEPFRAEGITLKLGETYRLNAGLSDRAVVLGGVQVTADRGIFDAERTGVSRNIGEAEINEAPTIGRDLADFVRLTPAAIVGNDDDDGPSISIAGQNNRYNSIYVDGAVSNDVFGLSAQGTNGGQTGSTPIAIDAIEEFQVNLSPYDVTQSGFTGGAINAVTRSGTNQFQGSAYYYGRNESFVGKTPPALAGSGGRQSVDAFSNQRFGARIGGPIIKDRLFFFANVEILRAETPQPFEGVYNGDTNLAGLESLRQSLISAVGYDAGEFGSKQSTLDDDKILAKLDWNASPEHKVSLRYSYSKSDNIDAFQSDASDIEFSNNSEVFPNRTHSLAGELNSTLGSDIANKLIVSYTKVDDDRGFAGDPFPEVNINDGAGEIHLGSEAFSTGNILEQDIITVTNNVNLFRGGHTLTVGGHFEYYDIRNLFIAQNFGVYDYNSVDDFLMALGGAPVEPDFFTRGYSLVDNLTGDASGAAGVFSAMQFGFYVQDEYQISDQLRLTGGIRLDIPKILDDPIFAPDVSATIASLEAAGNDLSGAAPGSTPKAAVYLSPRVGFNYDATGDRSVQIRGGVGVFNGRVPFVWPGGMFTNNGATVGRASGSTLPNGDPVPFIANPSNGLTGSDFGQTDVPSGRLEMFEDDYKYPRVLRTSLGVDADLGSGLVGTVEGQYTKNISNIVVRNLNLNPAAVETMDGPDNRPFYDGSNVFIDPRYEAIHVVGNTSEGYSYDVTGRLTGSFDDFIGEGDRFSFHTSITYGSSMAINDGTSSQINSIWRTVETIGLPNDPRLSRSDFSIGTRMLAGLTFRKRFGGNFAATASLLYQGESGQLFNYTIDRNATGGGFRDYGLVYVPNSASELTFIPVTLGGTTYSPSEQAAALDRYIDSSKELSDRRGRYAERNGSRMPFEHVVDLRLVLEPFGVVGGRMQKVAVTLDIFNLTNLLNKDWGQRYNGFTSSSNGGAEILEFNGFVDAGSGDYTPTYQLEFDPARTPTEDAFFDTRTKDFGSYSSRWQMQLGLRYTF